MSSQDSFPGIVAQLAELRTMLGEIHTLLARPSRPRESFTVEEAAELLGKSPYTVREWCRHGRIRGEKRAERRGGAELWNISAAEVTRYQDEGLLPPDPYRNTDR